MDSVLIGHVYVHVKYDQIEACRNLMRLKVVWTKFTFWLIFRLAKIYFVPENRPTVSMKSNVLELLHETLNAKFTESVKKNKNAVWVWLNMYIWRSLHVCIYLFQKRIYEALYAWRRVKRFTTTKRTAYFSIQSSSISFQQLEQTRTAKKQAKRLCFILFVPDCINVYVLVFFYVCYYHLNEARRPFLSIT